MFLLLLYLFVAIFFSFLCSILEAVILSTTPTFIEIKIEERKSYAFKLKQLKENIDKPLAAILTLNTFAHTIGAAGVGAQAQAIWGNEYLSVVSIVLTLLILFLSEIIPKTLGATYWKQLIPSATFALRVMIFVLYPFVIVSQFLTKIINKKKSMKTITRSDISILARIGTKAGVLNQEESKILKNILEFNNIPVKNILTPRTVVKTINEEDTIEDFYKNNKPITFSRLPVYKENTDNVNGFVLKDEILVEVIEKNFDKKISELKREIPVVFENYPVYKLFKEMIDKKEQIVLVIDEYGGMEGIVTLEDIVETLLGLEIVDETDTYKDLQVLAKQVWKTKKEKTNNKK